MGVIEEKNLDTQRKVKSNNNMNVDPNSQTSLNLKHSLIHVETEEKYENFE